jgi:hypothetical protein
MIGGAWLMRRKEKEGHEGKRVGCVYVEEAEVKRDNMRSDINS